MGHDRPPHFERGESNRRSARDPAASRLSDAANCGARRKTGDDGEGLEPGEASIGSSYLPSGARGLPHLRALGELNMIARRMAMNELVIGECQRRDHEPVLHPPILADPKRRRWCWTCWASMSRQGGLGHGSFSLLGIGVGPLPDCPSSRCGLNRRPAVSRPLSRRVAADPASRRRAGPRAYAGQNLLVRKPALLV